MSGATRTSCLVAAVLAALACWLPFQVPVRVAVARVTWSAGTDPASRGYLERKRHLRPLGASGDTWSYALMDTSPTALEAVRRTPGLTLVEGLDAGAGEPTLWRSLSVVDWLDRVHGRDVRRYLQPMTVVFAVWLAFVVSLLATSGGRAWLVSRVTPVDRRALGAYRLAVAAGLLVVVACAHWPAGWWVLPGFVLVAAFGAGVWPRVALAALAVLLASALGGDAADHDYFAPYQAWLLFLCVPWAEGVWPWQGREMAAEACAPSRRYGVALVIVPLVLGTAYLAAALAKLDQSTHAWLLGGAVRYHIAQDGPAAPGELWRVVASHDWLTRALSPMVIVLEALVILAVLLPRPAVRAAAGAVALSLHLGFGTLQGVWWEAWWVLLPAFLPWAWVVDRWWPVATTTEMRPVTTPVASRWPAWVSAALALFLVQQPVASALRLEWKPFLSNFPMYSNVAWASKAEYAAHMDRWKQPQGRALRLLGADGSPVEAAHALRALEACGALAVLTAPVTAREAVMPDERTALDRCAAAYAAGATTRPTLSVEASPRRFSWEVVDFVPTGELTAVGSLASRPGGLPAAP